MCPRIDATWAAVYLQVLAGLLVFALAIPTLISQLAVREEVRDIACRRWRPIAWYVVIAGIAVGLMLIVWCLHPVGAIDLCTPDSLAMAIIMTGGFAAVLLLWAIQTAQRSRETLAKSLEKMLSRSWLSRQSFEEDVLVDLVVLGREGRPGYEKRIARNSIRRLVALVAADPRYTGDQLEALLASLEDMTLSGSEAMSEDDVGNAISIVSDLMGSLQARGYAAGVDYGYALASLQRLVIGALRRGFESPALDCVQSGLGGAEFLYEVGREALARDAGLVAIATLNNLEAIIQSRNDYGATEEMFFLIGLMGHFAASGRAARSRVRTFVETLRPQFRPSFECLRSQAYRFHLDFARYDTADVVILLP